VHTPSCLETRLLAGGRGRRRVGSVDGEEEVSKYMQIRGPGSVIVLSSEHHYDCYEIMAEITACTAVEAAMKEKGAHLSNITTFDNLGYFRLGCP